MGETVCASKLTESTQALSWESCLTQGDGAHALGTWTDTGTGPSSMREKMADAKAGRSAREWGPGIGFLGQGL